MPDNSDQELNMLLGDPEIFARECLTDRHGNPWQVRPYQRESLLSSAKRKVHQDGRDVGKTSEIEILTAWSVLNRPGAEMLIATQRENHLFPIMERLIRLFEGNSIFKEILLERKRSPSYYLRFSNGFQLWGRIAGHRGINFQGMHVDIQLVDEAQEMTGEAWGELYQALNGEGIRWVYGVPNGLRNTFYRMTNMSEYEQYRWPSDLNPEFTEAKREELIKLYGGINSEGYIHQVLGLHGSPACAAFDLDRYLSCIDSQMEFADISISGPDAILDEMLDELPGPVKPSPGSPFGATYLGCDLGYTRDPSELVVYRTQPHEEAGATALANIVRVHLENVDYHTQQEFITALDEHFRFTGIGIDQGNNGAAVCHNLQARNAKWQDLLQGYFFGQKILARYDADGRPIHRMAKRFMTQLIEERLRERTIVFPPINDREEQYAAHTYHTSKNGRIIYSKGNDHIIDADRCAVLRFYLDNMEDHSDPGDPGVIVAGF